MSVRGSGPTDRRSAVIQAAVIQVETEVLVEDQVSASDFEPYQQQHE